MTVRLAKALVVSALVLFLISGADVATNVAGVDHLLPLSSIARGMIFGFGAVALATAAFPKSFSHACAHLLQHYWTALAIVYRAIPLTTIASTEMY